MTHPGSTARTSNRVLIALVILMIAVVAYWAVNGGLDQIPAGDTTPAAATN